MEFTFLKGDSVAFFRSDAQTAEWIQEEMNIHCTFPFLADKTIERGMIILFQDPATDDWQAFTIRQCKGFTDYQQIETEHVAVTELSSCHVPGKIELDNVTAQEALNSILPGTGWSIGNIGSNPVSSGDLSRGSVWQNISTISSNWNVFILPRVTVNASGIVGRFLDLIPATGTDRGLRLAVNKNVTDPCVTYDDSELRTALYGYGGTYSEGTLDERVTHEYNFSEVVWNKTSEHPAKPAGQKYLEYPEMTALYGVNGKPRFGYYQNTNISDPAVLLQKTWETLKNCCKPKISITGTATDLKRLGYADVPLRLYDMAIIEIEPLGLLFYKQVVKLTVNLLDPTKNLPTIGDYIPNIIFINRDTESFATGGGKGSGRGGGGRGMTKLDEKNSEYDTGLYDTGRELGAYARKTDENGNILNQAGMHIDPETGVLVYSEDNVNMVGSKFHVQSDRITAEVTNRQNADTQLSSRISQAADAISLEVSERKGADNALSGRITVEKNRITQEVIDRMQSDQALSGRIDVEAGKITQIVSAVGEDGQVTAASICLAINNGGSTATINASKIYLLGQTIANTITADYISGKIATLSLLQVNNLQANGTIYSSGNITTGGDVLVPSGVGSIGLKNAVYGLQIVQNGNTYTLQKNTFTNSTWQDVGSFSRAVTSFGFAWGSGYSGQLTITANPQGQTAWVSIYQGTSTWNGRTVTIPIKSVNSESQSTEPTVYEATATYTLPKSDISAARGNPSSTQISSDDSITGITQNGYYQITVTAAGTSKTYSMHVNVPSTVSKSDISAARGNASSTQIASDDTITTITDNGYYQITVTVLGTTKTFSMRVNHNPYPNSMTLSQKVNASGSRQFTAYYLNGSTYVSMGSAYWYSSSTNLNTSSKTVHY